ncbi:MAG TPA: hypothetical protein VLD57_06690, partial [Blastocatellia bacterium]|nr:hypothetical protein [Blastocatellia bacterium]
MSPRGKKQADRERKQSQMEEYAPEGCDDVYVRENPRTEVIRAAAGPGGCDLRVQVHALPCSDAEHEHYQNYTPINDHDIRVFEIDYAATQDQPYYECRKTAGNGETVFRGLRAGRYRVSVNAPPNYRQCSHQEEYTRSAAAGSEGDATQSVGAGGYGLDQEVEICDGEARTVSFEFAPHPAHITGIVYSDPTRCGDPRGNPRISGAPVDFYRGGERIASAVTGEDGSFDQVINCPGTISILP